MRRRRRRGRRRRGRGKGKGKDYKKKEKHRKEDNRGFEEMEGWEGGGDARNYLEENVLTFWVG
jgi:hypothetical protein